MLEREAALLSVSGAGLHLGPVSAHVFAHADRGAVDKVGRAGEHPPAPIAPIAVATEAEYLPAVQVWPGHLPVPPPGVRLKKERAPGGADQQSYPASVASVTCHAIVLLFHIKVLIR